MLLLNDGWKTARYYKTSTGETEIIDELEVRVDGKFRYKSNKKELFISTSGVYPAISLYLNGWRNKATRFAVHILMISTFCETPKESGITVDHIDRNAKNFSLNNLRFVSQSENLTNRSSTKQNSVYVTFDNSGKIIMCLFSEAGYDNVYKARKLMGQKGIVYNFSIDSFNRLKENLETSGFNYLNSLTWKEISPGRFISNTGLIRKDYKKLINYTFGTKGPNGYYYYRGGVESKDKHSALVHVLVAEFFLNCGQKIPEGMVVDHIDTNRWNNSITNLRIVSMKENLNNLNTLEKFYLPIKCINIDQVVYFRSLTDCAKILKMNNASSICDWVKGRHSCTLYPGKLTNFEYVSEEELLNNNIKFIESFEELNLPAMIPRDIKTREEAIKFINDNKLTCKKDFIKKGLENFYNSIVKRFPPIVYYKE